LALTLIAALRAAAYGLELHRCARLAAVAPKELRARVLRIAREMDSRAPEVRLTSDTSIPFVTGILSPVLVLPTSVVDKLDACALDLAIRHEVAHLARGDVLWSAVVTAANAAFALHPSAPRLRREIALAREEAVDSIAGRPDFPAYARMLVEVAAAIHERLDVHGVGLEPSSLERRVDRLLDPRPERRARLRRLWVTSWAIVTFVLLSPRIGFGSGPPRQAHPSSFLHDPTNPAQIEHPAPCVVMAHEVKWGRWKRFLSYAIGRCVTRDQAGSLRRRTTSSG
jgi:beta-lactamase regulating signal transducer with metallopeptidase domain